MDPSAQGENALTKLQTDITGSSLPSDLKEKLLKQLLRLQKVSSDPVYYPQLEKELNYLEFITTLPFDKSSQDVLDIGRASQILDQHHYGLQIVKERILEYLSALILNSRQGTKMHAPVLAFVGLVGSGKTSLAYSIAESLGRKVIRIPFGGLGSVKELRGESRLKAEAEPGRILKSIQALGVNNPVILLDEIDRVAEGARTDVMGVLVELLDPEQNFAFLDYYIDYPFDLSNVLFIATANNLSNIATAVLDRLEIIEMPSYTDPEKIVIAQRHLLPQAVKEVGLEPDLIKIDEAVWPQIVRPLGYDGGIRSLRREIEKLTRIIAKEVVVTGNKGPYTINEQNLVKYIN